jgi:hypothetical protein
MVKKGLVTIASSFGAMIASFSFGVGPCGPSSIPGMILFCCGGLALLIGCGMIGFSLIGKLIRRVREVDELNRHGSQRT